jgi:multidrug efflux pump subunit AcrB
LFRHFLSKKEYKKHDRRYFYTTSGNRYSNIAGYCNSWYPIHSSLPIGQYPEITPPTVQVTGTYTGADALTVEQTVATPVEVQVNGTPGMTYLQSNSTGNGAMSMTVNFEVGTDINIAALDVQNRVGIATPTLPQEVQRLGIST